MSSLTWSVSYQRDRGFRLHLNESPTWVEAVSPLARVVSCFFTCRLPFFWAFKVGNKMIFALEDKHKEVGYTEIPKDMAFEIQPGYWEFFFEDDEDV